MNDRDGWTEPAFWDRFAPRVLHTPYQSLLANLFPLADDRIIQDGALFAAAKKMLAAYAAGDDDHRVLTAESAAQRKQQLSDAIASLDALIADYPAMCLSEQERAFYDVHFLTQAKMMREMYSFYLALIQAADDPAQLADAESALERFLTACDAAATGKWTGWYRGDKKVDVPGLLETTRAARRKTQ